MTEDSGREKPQRNEKKPQMWGNNSESSFLPAREMFAKAMTSSIQWLTIQGKAGREFGI